VKKLFVVLSLFILAMALQAADEPAKVSIDPDKAGPDYKIQGEYIGETAEKAKLGAEVITRADDKAKTVIYLVNFLPGGLRGEGGDYAKHVDATGKAEGAKVAVASKDGKWTATIESGKMTGKTAEGQAFTLNRVVRHSKSEGQKPPAGAVILFDGKSADEWKDAKMVGDNLSAAHDMRSTKKFKDHKAHVEFRLSYMPYATGQGRSNSGVYVQDRWEIQVLDSFGLKGENNECGGIYSQFKQSVNMCYPPLQWQTYDIDFKAAKFDGEKKTADAVISVWHNGVLIHDKVALSKGPTGGGQKETDTPGPYQLQGHGGQVQYRNIWVVEAK
jgi:hypothetical protein